MCEAMLHHETYKGKITSYFPSSPESQCKEEEETNELLSILLTPESTPTKDSHESDQSSSKLIKEEYEAISSKKCILSQFTTDSKSCVSGEKKQILKSSVTSTRKGRRGNKKAACASPCTSTLVKPKSSKGKKTESSRNSLVTDFFPVRRSCRVPSSEIKKRSQLELEDAILSHKCDGLIIKDFGEKGRGIVADKKFKRGDFVVEYRGDHISLEKAKEREQSYKGRSDVGCYMYYFTFKNKSYCVDATAENGTMGRLLNHSKTNPNCCTKVVGIGDTPYLILITKRDIAKGEELIYDYGDRNKETLEANPWLAF